MPDDHSEVVPLLPIPNRTVKRLSADDSAGSRVKVGHRQALTAPESPASSGWAFCVSETLKHCRRHKAEGAVGPRQLSMTPRMWLRLANQCCDRRSSRK